MFLIIDPSKCNGCMACILYCSLAHESMVVPNRSRIIILANRDRKEIIPITCVPCHEKPCLQACPEPGAIQLEPGGAVMIQEALCTACGKCARACEIGAIRIVRISGRGKLGRAVALKCDQCGGDPWCAQVCSPGAILRDESQFGSQAVYTRLLEARDSLWRGEEKP